jgi:hypothetical protein
VQHALELPQALHGSLVQLDEQQAPPPNKEAVHKASHSICHTHNMACQLCGNQHKSAMARFKQ